MSRESHIYNLRHTIYGVLICIVCECVTSSKVICNPFLQIFKAISLILFP